MYVNMNASTFCRDRMLADKSSRHTHARAPAGHVEGVSLGLLCNGAFVEPLTLLI